MAAHQATRRMALCFLLLLAFSRPTMALRSSSHKTQEFRPSNVSVPLLHPRACQGLSQQSCVDIFREHTATHVEHKRNLQIGFPSDYNHNPRAGTIKVLVLLIRFSDHDDRTLVSRQTIEDLWKGQIKDWFTVNAQGLYEVDPVVVDWFVTDNTEAFYADGQSGFTTDLKYAMYPALDKLDQEGFDWAPYDSDGNGRLDSVVMLHSGISAVAGNEDCFGVNTMPDRIWPHAFVSSTSSDTWRNADETVQLNGYTVNSVYDAECDNIPLTPGLTVHEYMHTMDTIDLYDGTDLSIAKGCGIWDIMGHPYGADNSGTPGLLGAWTKRVVGWVTPTEIAANGDYVSKPAHTHAEAYLIDLAQPDATAPEYLLIENRQAMGFEENLGASGLLVWHVDDAADGMKNRGYPGQPGWPENGNHYMVAVLAKDRKYQLEKNENFGDRGDLFGPGDKLTPGNGNTVFPNTDSYQGGNIVETGITLEVLTQEDNGDITFRISGLKQSSSSSGTQPPVTETPDPPAKETSAPTKNKTPGPTSLPPTKAPTPGPIAPPPPEEQEATAPAPTPGDPAQTTPQPTPAPTTEPPAAEPEQGPGPPLPQEDDTERIEAVPTTSAPVATPGPGSPTRAPVDPPRWILTRPPGPTRAPFTIPDIPYLAPLENMGGVNDSGADSASTRPYPWKGSIGIGTVVALLGFL